MDMRSPDLITFGETMGLFMTPEYRGLEHSATVEQSFGGAESNVAIGAARLGCSVGWFGALGDDPFGAAIYKTMRGEGVDVSRARLVAGAETGLMFRENASGKLAVHYRRKGSAASLMRPEQLDEAYIAGSKLLHVTGITAAIGEHARSSLLEAVRIARQAGVRICFDPNLRLKLWSLEEARRALLPLAEQADYYLPGWDELQLLYDTKDEAEILDRLAALKAVSVVKGYGEATLVLDNGKRTEVPFHPAAKVVDTVGAGDGFCAGFLAGIVKGETAVESVRIGSICGSLVVQGRGDWEALPDWRTVEGLLSDRVWVER
ncbi:2-dehydro-3-deoxygluconokinase [Paenibacillus darwinianus]|uniref:2-dehydro-3-deoxygluconokinase n=1 Tax=Paenibacillus darwinianus TaxID=1380763 RepID=A0A9W5W7N3_9BACL|nr:sugar kinase [Paenibacillus darwinianus]EXX89397.1 2-dehydro-3-deoxygluconokinase [Paenibacillus darwinianus]EXX90177.1 2-dehydro-3-deoxygluconokinase [Paenibacillus darwinianus]EXX91535.1 2-dehydro-3-deoxygluconokinase [Paenibacillus darwinianus]